MKRTEPMRRPLTLAATAALFIAFQLAGVLRPSQARAEGALAVGLPPDVARQGIAVGWVINHQTRREAQAQALKHCREFKDAPEATRALCKVIDSFRDQCIAIAMDPESGTPGVGWAVAAGQPAAESAAMTRCRATAGADRQKFCEVTVTRCDGR